MYEDLLLLICTFAVHPARPVMKRNQDSDGYGEFSGENRTQRKLAAQRAGWVLGNSRATN
jgi:hypothetical protein